MSVFAGEFYGATSFDDVMQQFVLIRGIERIMATKQGDFTTVWHWIMEGPMKAAMQGPLYSLPHSAKCAPALEKYFDGLRAMVLARCTGSEQTGPCFNAIRSLQKIYQAVTSVPEHVPKEVGMAWAWVTMVTQDFVELLQARHPVALVILLHFATLFVLFEDKWYVKSWSERSSSAIREQLPAEFWPEENLPGEAQTKQVSHSYFEKIPFKSRE
ncbi:hypothetical protein SLS56_008848 [Neofusicoccum ribis]|uniref:C6 finger domain protein n=1 Tax=Neofusicoccum ribis TaxID=45134 RepID=A0ABR3SJH4_9PEZI